jgi:glycosyltransferase involved in cell wall biosynthesis
MGFAILFFAGAVITLLRARLGSARCLAHINIAGRGSTLRKVALVTVARAIGMQYILHLHDPDYGNDYKRRNAVFKTLIDGAFRRAARVLVLGEGDRRLVSHLLGAPGDRVEILHNAVPDPVSIRVETRRAGRQCNLLFLGRLSARKGVPELLQALASPSLISLHWHATLAGDGPVEEYHALAEGLGLLERLSFPGWLDRSDTERLCAEADILVLPSHGEGLAMSVLEGLSYGLAVVTTPVGAHLEVIEPEVSGIFVPPGDVPALASALARVISDDRLRTRLQIGARKRFIREFNVDQYASRLGALHANLLRCACRARTKGEGQRS